MAAEQSRAGAGSLGPRLAGRLTAELILRSPQYLNPLKQYELDLRGNKIAAIENLGATENQFDSIDLSDNAIVRLEGFPRLLRLKQLLLNNNRITRVGKGAHEPIPNLEVLILTNNRLNNLQDLEPLSGFSNLTMLSLVGNQVVTKPNYRLFVISRCKALKVLDFKKVKQQEREEAAKLFPTDEAAAAHSAKTFEVDAEYEAATQGTAGGHQGAGDAGAATAAPAAREGEAAGGGGGGGAKTGPTPEQLVAIKAAIANAATMEEIRRLEAALTTGLLPSEIVLSLESQAPAAAPAGGDSKPAPGGDVEMADATVNGNGPEGKTVESNGGQAGEGQGANGEASKPDDMAVG